MRNRTKHIYVDKDYCIKVVRLGMKKKKYVVIELNSFSGEEFALKGFDNKQDAEQHILLIRLGE